MRDKSLDVFMMVLFGISGMAVLLLTWLGTILESERIMATLVGSGGLIVALTRVLMLKRSAGRIDDEPVPIIVKDEKKS